MTGIATIKVTCLDEVVRASRRSMSRLLGGSRGGIKPSTIMTLLAGICSLVEWKPAACGGVAGGWQGRAGLSQVPW